MAEFPSQTRNRKQWILDTVRANQVDVAEILVEVQGGNAHYAIRLLSGMHKSDRDALLQPNGILTEQQIELLK